MSHHVNAAEYQAAGLGSQLDGQANAQYPIEMLWAIGRRLAGKDFHTEKELAGELKRIWGEVAQESVDGLVESFRSRLELCLACNGASNSPLLSSHLTGPRPQDIADVDGFPAFTPEVDAANREWVGSHGNK
jgi:hypothetical protein